MLYVRIQNNVAISATTAIPADFDDKQVWIQNRNDWKTMERAEEVAKQLTEATGATYLATDSGPNCSPRFDVIEAPVLGAKVSQYFNGDAYPEGEITKISASFKRVETSTGKVFIRRKTSGSWLCGGFGMIAGHRNDRNPSF